MICEVYLNKAVIILKIHGKSFNIETALLQRYVSTFGSWVNAVEIIVCRMEHGWPC